MPSLEHLAIGESMRAAISNAYYNARNDGRTMEDAADDATSRIVIIIEETS